MDTQIFAEQLGSQMQVFQSILADSQNDWRIKGFIDSQKIIYSLSLDTKIISKLMEIMLLPHLVRFAQTQGFEVVLSEYQNHYPDLTLIAADQSKFALDLKSTYRVDTSTANGFTLGAFTGYFRQRNSFKNITFPYSEYQAHFVLGVIYTRRSLLDDVYQVYQLSELDKIQTVIGDFQLLLQEKWRVASDKTGSGNTKNIGSIRNIEGLVSGQGVFAPYGEQVFNDYWINYLTEDMARQIDSTLPYHNLGEYWVWRNR